ncbi:MAG: mismatch repair protein MutS [Hyphomicrobiales bacterium]|nr:mismatch repair protein MutS [Hyphomicrobiales bacterium]
MTSTTDQRMPPPDRDASGAARMTPMMAQYTEIKAANPDCLLFYRMGDFYAVFFEDAEVASRALGIVLTKRGKHLGEDVAMCGVPIDRSDDYLQRLIGLGHRVAVCEQMEDPAEARKRGAKSVVRRDVVRLVTPGTITEERLLEPGRANLLLALARARQSDESFVYGIAVLDISTGAFTLTEAPEAGLAAEIARFEPREIVVPEALADEEVVRRLAEDARLPLGPVPRETGEQTSAERRIRDYYGIATLDGFGSFSRAEIAAAAVAIAYVERTQIGVRPPLGHPERLRRGATLEIDAATRANLELTRTLAGTREGSLLAAIDCTVTPAGGRLLAERLAAPLTDRDAILRRQDALAFFLERPTLRADLRQRLRSAPDLARALSRLALQRGGPRDLACLRDGLQAARQVAALLRDVDDLPADLTLAVACLADLPYGVDAGLAAALADDLPLVRRDGGFVRPGYEAALDEARALRDESRRVVAAMQAGYCERAETKQLKIKHNNFLGFFIEVPQVHGERLLRPPFNETFIHRQTMADAMRFSTTELAEIESKIASAADRALALELSIFDDLSQMVLAATDEIKKASGAIAEIDVAAALAEVAALRDWVRPHVDESLAFRIVAGRHPVVEAALRARGQGFVANDCDLADAAGGAGRIAVITGPNMAGKSTYLRQNALLVVLAQMGAYVPAREAAIGLVDRLFSRVGAADDLARGRSTFMVEMVETAAILNQATARSLVILDEIGRGTATFDGLSIAWATVEHLHDGNRSRALFATHFHELTQLSRKLARLTNLTVRVTEWNGDVIFLHEVVAGAADRSYGIQVAKLAGLPPPVVARAKRLLAELEAGERQAPVQRMIDDLPLFAALKAPEPAPARPDALRARLRTIDPDDLSPKAALEALYELKRLLEDGQAG